MAAFDITPTVACPNVANATSVVILAANQSRRGFRIQNNTAGTIAWSEAGFALTGTTPTLANPCELITAGAYFESSSTPDYRCSTTDITVYQSSGSSTNLITVIAR